MMTELFMAFIAFSLALIAFCAGAWLTLWSTSANSQCTEVSAGKLSGYFITVLAVIALIFTSYYTAHIVFSGSAVGPKHSKMSSWSGKKHGYSIPKKTQNPTATSNKSQ